jgi:hypothetical protein
MGGNLSALPALAVQNNPPNPLAEFSQVAALQRSIQQQQLQQQELQIKQQQATDLQATTQAMKDWDPNTEDYNALTQKVLANGGSANAATAIQQHGLQVQQLATNLSKDQLQAFQQKHKASADDLQPLTDPSIVPDDQLHSVALDHVMSQMHAGILSQPEAQTLIAGIQQTADPANLRTLIMQKAKTDLGMAGVMAQQKEAAETGEAQQKGREAAANATIKEIEAKGLQGITPDYINQTAQDPVTKQQALAALGRGDVQGAKDALTAGFKAQLDVQKEINPQVQANKIETAKAEGAARLQQQASLLNPEAAQMAAQMYTQTGALPSGMRSPGMAAGILNAAATGPGGVPNVAANKQSYQANTQSLESLQKNADQVAAFENTAGKNLDVFLRTAQPILDSGSPWINKPLRSIDAGALGSADQAAFNAARVTAVTEIAKVLNSSNASGVLSDSARSEVQSLIGPDASLKQIYSAANILKQDMANRHQAYQQQLGDIRARSAGLQPQTTPSAGKVLSQAAIQQAAKDHGVSVEEATRQAQAAGYTIQ